MLRFVRDLGEDAVRGLFQAHAVEDDRELELRGVARLAGARAHRVDERQRGLAFGEVVAEVLARLLDVAGVIENIVDELERRAEVHAVFGERDLRLSRGAAEDRAHLGRRLEELRRLVADHAQVAFLVGVGVVHVEELQHFSFGDDVGRIREHLHHAEAPRLDDHLEGARVEKIADEHGSRIAEFRVRGLPSAPEARFVDDVVVQERRGVDELDHRRELVPRASLAAESARREEHQRGPEPLAAAAHDVARDGADEEHVGGEALANHLVHALQIGVDRGADGIEADGDGGIVHGAGAVAGW